MEMGRLNGLRGSVAKAAHLEHLLSSEDDRLERLRSRLAALVSGRSVA
jgi:hypothetical protein